MARTTPATEATRLKFTEALWSDIRRRYEETDEPVASIAADVGCAANTLHNYARREGWVRYVKPPRDLSDVAKLALRTKQWAEDNERAQSAVPTPLGEAAAAAQSKTDGRADTAAALLAAARHELEAFKASRAKRAHHGQNLTEQRLAAQVLATLTQIVQRLEAGSNEPPVNQADEQYDDMPRDIDEFRNELTRRIDALLTSPPDEGDAAQAGALGPVDQ